jgi:hypothetical protein
MYNIQKEKGTIMSTLSEIYTQSRQPQTADNSCWLATLSAQLRAVCIKYNQSHCANTTELEIFKILRPNKHPHDAETLRKSFSGKNINSYATTARQVFRHYLPQYNSTFKPVRSDGGSAFEESFRKDLRRPNHFVIANVEQAKLLGKGGGHFVPVAPFAPSSSKETQDPALFHNRKDLIPQKPEVTVVDADADLSCIPQGYSWVYHRSIKNLVEGMHTRRPGCSMRGYVAAKVRKDKNNPHDQIGGEVIHQAILRSLNSHLSQTK